MAEDKKDKYDTIRKCIVYLISLVLIIVSFVLPPQGQIDPSVLMGVGIMIAGYEWLFGHSIRQVDIDKSGIHISTHDDTK